VAALASSQAPSTALWTGSAEADGPNRALLGAFEGEVSTRPREGVDAAPAAGCRAPRVQSAKLGGDDVGFHPPRRMNLFSFRLVPPA
jgi:hypothetical protein